MTEQEIRNLCALHGCVIKRQIGSAVRYEVRTHDGLYVIDWSFKIHPMEWYAKELEAGVRKARADSLKDIGRPYD